MLREERETLGLETSKEAVPGPVLQSLATFSFVLDLPLLISIWKVHTYKRLENYISVYKVSESDS